MRQASGRPWVEQQERKQPRGSARGAAGAGAHWRFAPKDMGNSARMASCSSKPAPSSTTGASSSSPSSSLSAAAGAAPLLPRNRLPRHSVCELVCSRKVVRFPLAAPEVSAQGRSGGTGTHAAAGSLSNRLSSRPACARCRSRSEVCTAHHISTIRPGCLLKKNSCASI